MASTTTARLPQESAGICRLTPTTQAEILRSVRLNFLSVAPGYTISQLRGKRYSDHPDYQRLAEKYWYEGLRKAGIPEQ